MNFEVKSESEMREDTDKFILVVESALDVAEDRKRELKSILSNAKRCLDEQNYFAWQGFMNKALMLWQTS